MARRAYGGIPSPDASNATNALSKLSDAFINQYLGLRDNGPLKRVVFRFSSDCFGPGQYRVAAMSGGFGMFMDANLKSYDDRKSGMGLLYDARAKFLYGSQPGKTFPSRWWGGLRSVFDTPHAPSHMLGWSDDKSMRPENTCMRWFQGHRGGSNANNWHCYNPRSGTSNGERCFSHGSSCICDGEGNHPQAQGVMIFAKLRADCKDFDTPFARNPHPQLARVGPGTAPLIFYNVRCPIAVCPLRCTSWLTRSCSACGRPRSLADGFKDHPHSYRF